MIEAVIFDMDGVLADTEYYYENRRKNFLLENGIPIPEGNFIGSNEKAIWEAIVPNDPVRRQEMLMAYREYRKARPTPYGKLTDPQAEPLMNALRSRGLKVAVASSSAAPDIMKMLTEGGLKAMVDFAFSGEDCAAHKPAPDIYLKALKALGLTADKAIAVEDSPTGIASAKAAGLKVLALKPRHGEPPRPHRRGGGIRRRRRLDGQLQQPFRALRRCAVGTLVIDDGERMQSVLGALRLERQPQVDQLLDVGLVADRNEYLHLVPVGFLDVRRLLHGDIVRPLLR